MYVSTLYHFQYNVYYAYFPKRSHDPEDIPSGVTYHAYTAALVLVSQSAHQMWSI